MQAQATADQARKAQEADVALDLGAKAIAESKPPVVEPEVQPWVDDAVQARMTEMEDMFSQGIGELSGKSKNLDTTGYNAEAMANLKSSDTGFGKTSPADMSNFKRVCCTPYCS